MAVVMKSVSGIRGIVGEGLTPQLVADYAAALGTWCGGGRIPVGRDSRVTGEMVKGAVFSGLLATGCEPIDLGLVPTPTVQLAVEKFNAPAGIVISASHNPAEWNALKLLGKGGLFLDEEEGARIEAIVREGRFRWVPWDRVLKPDVYETAVRDHIDLVLKIKGLDLAGLRKRRFRVAFDSVNGAGGVMLPSLLKELGCETVAVNDEPHGRFAHTPEPVPANLGDLSKLVRESRADIGFAVDPDADRCAIVAETGIPIGEEYTVVLAEQWMLSKRPGLVVVNVSTTRAVDDVAARYGVEVLRTKVGEIHVAKAMQARKAVIGGEGNGGVLLPEVHLGRDSAVAISLTLQHMLEHGGTLSSLWRSLPQYTITKKKIEIGGKNPDLIIRKLGEKYGHESLNWMDGLKIERADSWIQIRKSNTEPIIRVMTEATTPEASESLCDAFLDEVRVTG